MFGSEQKTPTRNRTEMDEVRPDDVIRIRRRSVELLRNSLMRHTIHAVQIWTIKYQQRQKKQRKYCR